jgi:hypothetical protein
VKNRNENSMPDITLKPAPGQQQVKPMTALMPVAFQRRSKIRGGSIIGASANSIAFA